MIDGTEAVTPVHISGRRIMDSLMGMDDLAQVEETVAIARGAGSFRYCGGRRLNVSVQGLAYLLGLDAGLRSAFVDYLSDG